MKILVAGGCGYVGSVLVPALLERGYDVDVIDLLWFGNFLPPGVRVVQKDIHNCTSEDIKGYEQVIFLAGLSNDPMAEFDPARNFIYNASLPSYLAFLCRNAGVKRFIYASSCSVYGYTINEFYDEDSPTICNYPYGISKLQGEKGVMQLATNDFSVISLRKGTICGDSPRMRFDLVVNTMFKAAFLTSQVIVHNASLWRPILDMRDAVNGYIRAIQSNYSISGIFNIVSDNYTIGDIGDLVKFKFEQKDIPIKIDVRNWQDLRNYKVTWDKATKVLSYKPLHDVKDIIDNLFDNIDKYGDFTNPNFYNIEICKQVFKKKIQILE